MGLGYRAKGNISPSVFVKNAADRPSGGPNFEGYVEQCGVGEAAVGVSQKGTRNAPYSTLNDGFAAVEGDPIAVTTFKTSKDVVYVRAGGTIANGANVTSDANGNAIAATTTAHQVNGVAQQNAVSGDLVMILVEKGGFAAIA